jgi:hypothetical protein
VVTFTQLARYGRFLRLRRCLDFYEFGDAREIGGRKDAEGAETVLRALRAFRVRTAGYRAPKPWRKESITRRAAVCALAKASRALSRYDCAAAARSSAYAGSGSPRRR